MPGQLRCQWCHKRRCLVCGCNFVPTVLIQCVLVWDIITRVPWSETGWIHGWMPWGAHLPKEGRSNTVRLTVEWFLKRPPAVVCDSLDAAKLLRWTSATSGAFGLVGRCQASCGCCCLCPRNVHGTSLWKNIMQLKDTVMTLSVCVEVCEAAPYVLAPSSKDSL